MCISDNENILVCLCTKASSSLYTLMCQHQSCFDHHFSCPLHRVSLAEVTCKNLFPTSSQSRADQDKGECCPKKCSSGNKCVSNWEDVSASQDIHCVCLASVIALRASVIVYDLTVSQGRTQSFLLSH